VSGEGSGGGERGDGAEGGADRRARDGEERPARDSFWALIPRRSLMTAAVMVLILVAVIALRQRAGALARAFGQALLGAPPAAAPPPPRVRMAPPR
jgi:hypothetical protein